jgi:hypothetical protein
MHTTDGSALGLSIVLGVSGNYVRPVSGEFLIKIWLSVEVIAGDPIFCPSVVSTAQLWPVTDDPPDMTNFVVVNNLY